MAVSAQALSQLIISKINQKMTAIDNRGPLAQEDPSYFNEFCTAIGTGIISGSTVIDYVTVDTGLAGAPSIPGVGLGEGIIVDSEFFTEQIYTNCRNQIISMFGSTLHDPYIPGAKNSGQY